MKILHISNENLYGAGKAAYRISQSLNTIGIDSKLFVLQGNPQENVILDNNSKYQRILRYTSRKLNLNRIKNGYHAENFGIVSKKLREEMQNADIIHLHWINNGIWSSDFTKLLIELNKPIIWTLHDMWPFTGGCHYSGDCLKYKVKCNNCHYNEKIITAKFSLKEQQKKINLFNRLNISFVGCSNWITNEFNESYVGKKIKSKCICIPNPLDSKYYHYIDKKDARKILNITTSKNLILFGAGSTKDSRKGFTYLKEALQRLDKEDYCVGFFGGDIPSSIYGNYEVLNFGYIADDVHLALIYSSADVFVAPSLQENLANTVMESLGCGTPVVAFNIGGMQDMIQNGINGILVKPFSTDEMAEGIKKASKLKNTEISENTDSVFSIQKIANQYMNLYMKAKEGINS